MGSTNEELILLHLKTLADWSVSTPDNMHCATHVDYMYLYSKLRISPMESSLVQWPIFKARVTQKLMVSITMHTVCMHGYKLKHTQLCTLYGINYMVSASSVAVELILINAMFFFVLLFYQHKDTVKQYQLYLELLPSQ